MVPKYQNHNRTYIVIFSTCMYCVYCIIYCRSNGYDPWQILNPILSIFVLIMKLIIIIKYKSEDSNEKTPQKSENSE